MTTPTIHPVDVYVSRYREAPNNESECEATIGHLGDVDVPTLTTPAGEASADPDVVVMAAGMRANITWEFPNLATDTGETPIIVLDVEAVRGRSGTPAHLSAVANVRYLQVEGNHRYPSTQARPYVAVLDDRKVQRRDRRTFARYIGETVSAVQRGSAPLTELCRWLDRPDALVTSATEPQVA